MTKKFEKLTPSQKQVEGAVRTLLAWAGDDPDRQGLRDTPSRVARAYKEWFKGYEQDPEAMLKCTFDETGGYDEIITLRDIPFPSFCEHHLAPITGFAHIGYLPKGRVVGISKLARVVDAFARRLQFQERLTAQIADYHTEGVETGRSCRRDQGDARLHDDTGRSQAWRGHGDQSNAGVFPRKSGHAS